MQNPPAEEQTY